jgi:hypothetical protein
MDTRIRQIRRKPQSTQQDGNEQSTHAESHLSIPHIPRNMDVLPIQAGTILQLQATIGNRAVQRLLSNRIQRESGDDVYEKIEQAKALGYPEWWDDQDKVKPVQQEMKRIGTYRYKNVDGDYGAFTDSAMVESFGGDSFRKMPYETVLENLKKAKPIDTAGGDRGEKMLRYGEMLSDGVLDITIGMGHDENGWDVKQVFGWESEGEDGKKVKNEGIIDVLTKQNFVFDHARAAELYEKAGRKLDTKDGFYYLVRENAFTYKPPAGEERQIHAVVRLISNTSGKDGGNAADAFREGMAQSDATYYTGHGRYGSGMDFDRNYGSFTLLNADGNVESTITDYTKLEEAMAAEGQKAGRSAWKQFLWRHEKGRLKVDLSNAGNILMNDKNQHKNEFGSNLIYWALEQSGAKAQTGKEGAIAQEAAQAPSKDYRLIVFAGCRTEDYEKQVRGTTGFSNKEAHLIDTNQTVRVGPDSIRALAAFVEGILSQYTSNDIVGKMNAGQHGSSNPYQNRGTAMDPLVQQ